MYCVQRVPGSPRLGGLRAVAAADHHSPAQSAVADIYIYIERDIDIYIYIYTTSTMIMDDDGRWMMEDGC